MPTSLARAFGALCLLLSFCLFSVAARADLIWNPQTGWRIEGGILSGLSGKEGKRALDLMNKARSREEKHHYGSAIRAYKKVGKKYAASVYAPEAYYRQGRLYLLRRQYVPAFTALQTSIQHYPDSKRFNEIIGEEYRIASALLDGARPRYFGWIPGFRNREKSVVFFETILVNAPYSDYAPLALMNIARAHLRFHNTEEALDALDRMINTYPQSLLAPDAYLKLAQTNAKLVDGPAYDQTATKEAITYYQDFMILFPNDPNVPTAAKGLDQMKAVLAKSKITIGDFYFYKRSNYTAARVFYNEAITAFPDSEVAQLAKVKLGEVEARASGHQPVKKKKRFWLF